jgi:4-carboxymuconolactone decarboxylase
MMCQHHPIAKATAVAALLLATAGPAFAQTTDQDRYQRGEAMIRTLNAGESQATLEGLRREFPFLADAITGYAMGDVWARPVLDHRARQIAAVSAYAALGNRTFMKIHAGYALNLGVSGLLATFGDVENTGTSTRGTEDFPSVTARFSLPSCRQESVVRPPNDPVSPNMAKTRMALRQP